MCLYWVTGQCNNDTLFQNPFSSSCSQNVHDLCTWTINEPYTSLCLRCYTESLNTQKTCNMTSNLFLDSLVNQQQFRSQLLPCQHTFCFSCHSLPTSQQIRSGLTTHIQRRHSKQVCYIITLLLYTQSLTLFTGTHLQIQILLLLQLANSPFLWRGDTTVLWMLPSWEAP